MSQQPCGTSSLFAEAGPEIPQDRQDIADFVWAESLYHVTDERGDSGKCSVTGGASCRADRHEFPAGVIPIGTNMDMTCPFKF